MGIKAGIVGLGILGERYLETFLADARIDLRAICDVRPEALARWQHLPAVGAYTDHLQMLREVDLDLVVVATPDATHAPPVLAAVAAGVPFLVVEKPLATSMEDALAICEAVEARGTKLYVDYANRAHPFDRATRYLLRAGLLGRAVHADSVLEDDIRVPTSMWGERSRAWTSSSSPAHFLLSHQVDLVRWYFAPAEVSEVYAQQREDVLGYTPDLVDAVLTLRSGPTVRLLAGWIGRMEEDVRFDLTLRADRGMLSYQKFPPEGCGPCWRADLEGLDLEGARGHLEDLRGLGLVAHLRLPSSSPDRVVLECQRPPASDLMALVRHIVDAIVEGTDEPTSWRGMGPLPGHMDGLRQVAVVEAVLRSARTGGPVEVSN